MHTPIPASSNQRDRVQASIVRLQRVDPACLLGETLHEQALYDRLTAIQSRRDEQIMCARVRRQLYTVSTQISECSERYHRLDARITELKKQVGTAEEQNLAYRRQADEISVEIGEKWFAELASRESYQQALAEIDLLRPVAEKLDALSQASGRLDQINADLQRLSRQIR
jgi:chromosome segregation ATPase